MRIRIGTGTSMGMGQESCNACSTRLLLAPGRYSPPGFRSFTRVALAEQSKLIQHRNLVDFFVRARPRGGAARRRRGRRWGRVAVEGGRVAEEAFRHVSGAMSAAVADLDDVPRGSRRSPTSAGGLRRRLAGDRCSSPVYIGFRPPVTVSRTTQAYRVGAVGARLALGWRREIFLTFCEPKTGPGTLTSCSRELGCGMCRRGD
jgi:hypothetical protein